MKTSLRRVLLGSVPSLAIALAACSDSTVAPARQFADRAPATALARLSCEGNVAQRTISCASDNGVSAAARSMVPGAANRATHILGGQGLYIRLTASAGSYDAGAQLLSAPVTVQNLTGLALATVDGATRTAEGVRVYLIDPPATTGGTGTVTATNATGTGTFTAANQSYWQYGGAVGGVDQAELGADGVLASGEVSAAMTWQFNLPNTVTTFTFQAYVSTETPSGAITTAAPQVTAVSPATMVPGAAATLTGYNFSSTPASNTVRIGGQTATVTAASPTSLTVTVPCTNSGNRAVNVTEGGKLGMDFTHPLQVTTRTVAIGQPLVLTSSSDSHCNELSSANGTARYIVSVFSVNPSPGSSAPFNFTADHEGAPAASTELESRSDIIEVPPAAPIASGSIIEVINQAAEGKRLQKHTELMEKNALYDRQLRAKFGTAGRPRSGAARNTIAGDPALTRTFRVANINGSFCNSYYVVSATRVYWNGKIAIYEDDATPNAFKSSVSATMASNYQKIGDQFNADMEPVVRNNFGDILRRDAVTDNDGLLIALFTPRINTSFAGVAGYVVSCDQYPNDDANTPAVGGPYTGTGTNGSSNFGELFYAYQPVVDAVGYSGNTPQNWYRTIRSTFIHESKHVASMAARVANGAPQENGWLEEGMARMSEEMWIRTSVDPSMGWKGNNVYGSAANPLNVYCDVRPEGFPECLTNPRRPANGMNRHFSSLYTHLFGTNARLLSPFGATASDNQSYFYAISWSLLRYAADRYAGSEAAFFTALTNSSSQGVTNLLAQSGASSLSDLLGGWNLALATDDHPLMGAAPNVAMQYPTWNFRNVYAGMNADIPGTFTLAYPQVPTQVSFGSFTPTPITTLRGGGALWYEISGTQTTPQLLRLRGNGGAALPADVRLAVTRIQ